LLLEIPPGLPAADLPISFDRKRTAVHTQTSAAIPHRQRQHRLAAFGKPPPEAPDDGCDARADDAAPFRGPCASVPVDSPAVVEQPLERRPRRLGAARLVDVLHDLGAAGGPVGRRKKPGLSTDLAARMVEHLAPRPPPDAYACAAQRSPNPAATPGSAGTGARARSLRSRSDCG